MCVCVCACDLHTTNAKILVNGIKFPFPCLWWLFAVEWGDFECANHIMHAYMKYMQFAFDIVWNDIDSAMGMYTHYTHISFQNGIIEYVGISIEFILQIIKDE